MYEIRKGVPVPSVNRQTGLTATLRRMEQGDSIVVPADKVSSMHPCAIQAGVKIMTQKNDDGTFTVWRTDTPAAGNKSAPESAAACQPKIIKAAGGHYIEQEYRPNIFVPDEVDIFGRPVVPEPKSAPEPESKKTIFS
jgi:hypothetical protein